MNLDIKIESKLRKRKVTNEEYVQFKNFINSIRQNNLTEKELYEEYKKIQFTEILDAGFEAFIEFADPFIFTLQEISNLQEKNKNKLKRLLNERFKLVGKILSCHLLVEYLINSVVIKSKKTSANKFHNQKYGFSEKVEQLNLKESDILFKNALLNLNTIRNGFAHHFKFDASTFGTKGIDRFLKTIDTKNLKPLSNIEKIEQFTEFCILYFGLQSKEIKNKFNELKIYYKQEGNVVKRTNAAFKKKANLEEIKSSPFMKARKK